ncbi:hypothetical protein PHPALM_30872 [Phytophthora palmivora]|uniref:Uncharacterized protein n=1 Tax=Phytophthora palmivora TaxID=4796 RepID=A0A2P4X411_9STRA|nr:hypothetical protein PHPALM_30872 [Phytophthora palmivora]
MEQFANMASPAFFSALQSWKGIVQNGLREIGEAVMSSSGVTTVSDENDQTDDANTASKTDEASFKIYITRKGKQSCNDYPRQRRSAPNPSTKTSRLPKEKN